MTLTEKAAYIKGLADGLDFDKTTAEGKLIAALLDLTSELCDAIDEIDEDLATLNDYIEEIDEDLGTVEEILCDEEDFECDEDCDCCCDDECDCCCEDDEDYFEVDCPACGETICFDGSIDPEELACPACGEKFECIVDEDDLNALDGQ